MALMQVEDQRLLQCVPGVARAVTRGGARRATHKSPSHKKGTTVSHKIQKIGSKMHNKEQKRLLISLNWPPPKLMMKKFSYLALPPKPKSPPTLRKNFFIKKNFEKSIIKDRGESLAPPDSRDHPKESPSFNCTYACIAAYYQITSAFRAELSQSSLSISVAHK